MATKKQIENYRKSIFEIYGNGIPKICFNEKTFDYKNWAENFTNEEVEDLVYEIMSLVSLNDERLEVWENSFLNELLERAKIIVNNPIQYLAEKYFNSLGWIYLTISDDLEKRMPGLLIENKKKHTFQIMEQAYLNQKYVDYKYFSNHIFIEQYGKNYKKFLQTPYWKIISKEKMKQVDYTCQLCGKKNLTLNVHHSTYDIWCLEIYNMNKLIVLCQNCHSKFHNKAVE